jgi:hypothetical protein
MGVIPDVGEDRLKPYAHEISERFPIPCDEDRLEEGSIDVNRFKTSKA